MQSIASSLARARERAKENAPLLDEAARAVSAAGEFGLPADAVLEQRRMQTLCAALLDELSQGDEELELLVDGLGLGLRGVELRDHLGVTAIVLATARRRLKRMTKRLQDKFLALPDTPAPAEILPSPV